MKEDLRNWLLMTAIFVLFVVGLLILCVVMVWFGLLGAPQ